jgi:predicted transcriptional regulator
MFDFVLGKLDQCKGQLPRVATESGVPYRTLQKIVSREIKDPGVSTVQKLYDYLHDQAVPQ